MEVQIYFRVVYGLQKIYPANAAARKFAELLGVKTFTNTQLLRIQELGHQVFHVHDPKACALASDLAAAEAA
ncbi:MAG: hypothetical protein V4457_06055 [Pseudomonadota bacterium]